MTARDSRDPTADEHDDLDATVRDALGRHLRDHQASDDQDDDDEIGDAPPERSGRRRWLSGGIAGVLLVVVLAAVRGFVTSDPRGDGAGTSAWDTIYARQEVKVRAQAGADYLLVRTLDPGDAVTVYARDRSGWVRIYELDGHPIGFAYRSQASFGTIPPATTPRGVFSSALPPAPSDAPSPTSERIDTTAICVDRTAVYSPTASGTCRGHGGVLCWIHHPGPNRPTTAGFCTVEDRRGLRDSAALRR